MLSTETNAEVVPLEIEHAILWMENLNGEHISKLNKDLIYWKIQMGEKNKCHLKRLKKIKSFNKSIKIELFLEDIKV